MKKLLILLIAVSPLLAMAQPFHVTLFGGLANYQGDLQDKRYTISGSKAAFGFGAQYDLNNHLSVKAGMMFARIGADDKNSDNVYRKARNLNFQSNITEGSVLAQWDFMDLSESRFSPYVFAGIGFYHFNPYSYDTLGRKVFLQPLSTEGQGLAGYPDRKPYHLTQFTIPFGIGLHFKLAENLVLGYEIGFRPALTDYLDDVSKTYVDHDALLAAKGPLAVEMAYRGGELKDGDPTYPADGAQRGGANHKDWYYFSGFSLSIGLSKNGRTPKGLGCPTRVY